MCGGLGGSSVSIPRGLAGEPPGPSPAVLSRRSISQPLALFLHLKGSERLTVYWLPGWTHDMRALWVCSCCFLFTCQCVSQCLSPCLHLQPPLSLCLACKAGW